MNHKELKTYIDAQVNEIQKYKWIESQRRQHDIGFNRAAEEWIGQYGEHFHDCWLKHKPPKQQL